MQVPPHSRQKPVHPDSELQLSIRMPSTLGSRWSVFTLPVSPSPRAAPPRQPSTMPGHPVMDAFLWGQHEGEGRKRRRWGHNGGANDW